MGATYPRNMDQIRAGATTPCLSCYGLSKNDAILINHRSFFQGKDSPQLQPFCFSKINYLIAETMKNSFAKEHFYKQIAGFDNN